MANTQKKIKVSVPAATSTEEVKTIEQLEQEQIDRITKVKERIRKNSNYDWQPDEVIEIIAKGIDMLETDANIFSMLGVTAKLGLYDKWFRNMKAKYPDNQEISNGIAMIKSICEFKTHQFAANGTINPVVGIFSLKAYHKRVEQQHVKVDSDNKHSHSGQVDIVLKEADGSVYNPDEKIEDNPNE